ncbi:unnamed protein product, partial [Didymodactylos carnosus]
PSNSAAVSATGLSSRQQSSNSNGLSGTISASAVTGPSNSATISATGLSSRQQTSNSNGLSGTISASAVTEYLFDIERKFDL